MDKVIEIVLHELRDKRSQIADALANNGAKNYEQYQYMCGEIRGLTAVEMYLLDLAKNLEKFEDD
jgi:predicted transcriptional regulator YheO